MEQEGLFYEDRFLESWAGSIITNPSTAIVELVANCWDAYATEVNISWSDVKAERQFSISDNGIGMTRDEFKFIWRAMSYDRVTRHGTTSNPPPGVEGLPRPVFGKNGKGRFASFCFTTEYLITSRKDGQEFAYRVHRKPDNPLVLEEVAFIDKGAIGHGTEIKGSGAIPKVALTEDQARELLSSRFLANPAFKVFLNKKQITFNDIAASSLEIFELEIPSTGIVKIYHIDALKADKTLVREERAMALFAQGYPRHTCLHTPTKPPRRCWTFFPLPSLPPRIACSTQDATTPFWSAFPSSPRFLPLMRPYWSLSMCRRPRPRRRGARGSPSAACTWMSAYGRCILSACWPSACPVRAATMPPSPCCRRSPASSPARWR
ncbi:MAG: ATP-binding protein [Sulfuricellaceae bacterium]|nr:ATP-binding protein [Sulfuricellaceae bacterium]